jgi:hypothetical protein
MSSNGAEMLIVEMIGGGVATGLLLVEDESPDDDEYPELVEEDEVGQDVSCPTVTASTTIDRS